jgi:hypothetical protein
MKIAAATSKNLSRVTALASSPSSAIPRRGVRWEMAAVAALIVLLSLAGIVLVSLELLIAIPGPSAMTAPVSDAARCGNTGTGLPEVGELRSAPVPVGPAFAC